MTTAQTPAPSQGIDQMQRTIAALSVVLPKLIVQFKDGFQVTDITALMGDPTFMQAVNNIKDAAPKIKAEAEDLTLDEGIALVGPAATLVADIIKAVKAAPKN